MSARALAGLTLVSLLGACSVPEIDPEPVAAPFTLSDYFIPSGYMGDAALTNISPPSLSLSYERCKPRPAGAHGNCYRFSYQPVPRGKGFAGVYWQSPAGNWGQVSPQKLLNNAMRVTFYAAGEAGGELLTITVGGVHATDPDGAPLPYSDTLSASKSFVLTTTLTRYEVQFPPAAAYDHVVGAFSWSLSAAAASPSPQVVYLDDIQWLPAD